MSSARLALHEAVFAFLATLGTAQPAGQQFDVYAGRIPVPEGDNPGHDWTRVAVVIGEDTEVRSGDFSDKDRADAPSEVVVTLRCWAEDPALGPVTTPALYRAKRAAVTVSDALTVLPCPLDVSGRVVLSAEPETAQPVPDAPNAPASRIYGEIVPLRFTTAPAA